MRSKSIVIAAVVLVLAGCDRRDADHAHATSDPTMSTGAVTSFITPPAVPERGPIPPDANAAAPGTNSSLAFAESSGEKPLKLPPSEGGTPEDLHVAATAQEAAAKAPDTAAADAAKRRVYEEHAEGGTAGGETVASASVGPPTTRPESREMPTAGQTNDHSSTALDKPSTRLRADTLARTIAAPIQLPRQASMDVSKHAEPCHVQTIGNSSNGGRVAGRLDS